MKLPLEAFVYSMEMLVETMRGIQQIAFQSMDMVTDGIAQPLVDESGAESALTIDVTPSPIGDRAETAQKVPQEEERKMADRNLHGDDELKLVRYKVLFVKRDYEYAFQEKEELVHEDINDASDYTGWKIAEFIQRLDKEPIPDLWLKKNFPRPAKAGDMIRSLDEDDKKYLRIYFEVLQRYPREKFRHDEEQIKILREIKDKLGDKVDIEKEQVAVLRQLQSSLGPTGGGQATTGGGQTPGGSSST
jgi:hypothetical protein